LSGSWRCDFNGVERGDGGFIQVEKIV